MAPNPAALDAALESELGARHDIARARATLEAYERRLAALPAAYSRSPSSEPEWLLDAEAEEALAALDEAEESLATVRRAAEEEEPAWLAHAAAVVSFARQMSSRSDRSLGRSPRGEVTPGKARAERVAALAAAVLKAKGKGREEEGRLVEVEVKKFEERLREAEREEMDGKLVDGEVKQLASMVDEEVSKFEKRLMEVDDSEMNGRKMKVVGEGVGERVMELDGKENGRLVENERRLVTVEPKRTEGRLVEETERDRRLVEVGPRELEGSEVSVGGTPTEGRLVEVDLTQMQGRLVERVVAEMEGERRRHMEDTLVTVELWENADKGVGVEETRLRRALRAIGRAFYDLRSLALSDICDGLRAMSRSCAASVKAQAIEMRLRARGVPPACGAPPPGESWLRRLLHSVLTTLQPLPLLLLYALLALLQAALAELLVAMSRAPSALRGVHTIASDWKVYATAVLLAAAPGHPDVGRATSGYTRVPTTALCTRPCDRDSAGGSAAACQEDVV